MTMVNFLLFNVIKVKQLQSLRWINFVRIHWDKGRRMIMSSIKGGGVKGTSLWEVRGDREGDYRGV